VKTIERKGKESEMERRTERRMQYKFWTIIMQAKHIQGGRSNLRSTIILRQFKSG